MFKNFNNKSKYKFYYQLFNYGGVMKIFNFLMSYIIFPLFFSSIVYIFTTIENHFYTKWLILILGLLIFINYYFYKKLVTVIRKTYVNRTNYYLSIILVLLTFFNIENFKEVITIINKNIKKNFNQEIFLEIKNILNTISYFYLFYFMLFMGIIFLLTIIYNIFKNRKTNEKVKENIEEIKLLSFREKEKEKLKFMIENKKISTILIEAEIGNGKTTLINNLFKDLQTEEIIYLKLPLIKSVDELKRNLFLELQKIFLKNDLDNQFINAFLDNISAFKLGFLEINFGKKENMWNTIQKLQNTLKELDKNIIIVLDDIERENDANKIYESLLFLGELSEYFKDTKTTTLFLAQYSYLEDKLKEINKDTLYLEKYYNYKFKLNEPTLNEFLDEDYRIIIDEAISRSLNLSIKNLKKEEFIISIIENITFFFQSFPKNDIKLNIRSLEKSIKKIIFLYTFYEESYITYTIFLYCILRENFKYYVRDYSKKNNILLDNFTKKIFQEYSKKTFTGHQEYNQLSKEINYILEIYKKGEIVVEELNINSNTIKNILNGKDIRRIKFSIDGYEEYIANLINESLEKLDTAIKNNLISKKSELIKIVNNIKVPLKLSEVSTDKIKELLSKREFTEHENKFSYKEADTCIEYSSYKNFQNYSYNDIKDTRYYYELQKNEYKFIQKLQELAFSKETFSKIKKILKEDNIQKAIENKYYTWGGE